MGDKTHISWSEATWSPVTGCTRVSEGCRHCYIERTPPFRMAHRRFDSTDIGATTGVVLHPERLQIPARWRKPRKIFVCSLADLFHDDVPDGYIAQVWEVMAHSPQHTFQILTKRPARMRSWVKRWHDTTGDDLVSGDGLPPMPRGPQAVREVYNSPRARLFADMLEFMGEPPAGAAYPLYDWAEGPRWYPEVLPNVWLGTSAEDQNWAEVRIPILNDTPAAIRFVSAEPLIGPIDLLGDAETPGPAITRTGVQLHPSGPWGPAEYDYDDQVGIHWLIVGGESGPGARAMHPDWARSLRDQCTSAGIAFHFKQFGEWGPAPWKLDRLPGELDMDYITRSNAEAATHSLPVWAHMYGMEPKLAHPAWGVERGQLDPTSGQASLRRWGKKRAGRELDGRTWDEYPVVGSPE